jgi:A/G-specific adenine glycosylase
MSSQGSRPSKPSISERQSQKCPKKGSQPGVLKFSSQASQRQDAAILTLAQWFHKSARVLPWRSDPSLYRVWISEIMLQQTQVVTVLPYFERFMSRFPNVEALARASESEVLEAWAGLGYYSRARNLHRGAQKIVAEGFPQSQRDWLEVPGVGPYTAGAISSIALGLPEPILDGNVERVLSRVLALSRAELGEAAFKARLWRWSAKLVLRAQRIRVTPSDFNQALMELGATRCAFRNPECDSCPIREACQARRLNRVDACPGKKKPKEWIRVEEVRHAWVRRNAQGGLEVLVREIAAGEWRAGVWDLPEQSPSLGAAVSGGEVHTKHVVTRHRIERTIKIWSVKEGVSFPTESARLQRWAWTNLEQPSVAASASLMKSCKQIALVLGTKRSVVSGAQSGGGELE